MSDLTVTTASFNQAYRGFAVEQGNSTFEAGVRAMETSELSAGTKAVALSEAGDALYISPAAAKMYAEQAKDSKQVRRKPTVNGYRDVYSSTAETPFPYIQEKIDSPVGESGDEDEFEG